MEKIANVGSYIVKHNMTIPTRLSDYDYDYNNPQRRFISTYIHTVSFLDPITNVELSKFHFDSTACADLISAMYNLGFGNGEYAGMKLTVNNIHFDNGHDGFICMEISNGLLRFEVCDYIDETVFNIEDPDSLLSLLDSEEIAEMFIPD